MYLLTFYFHDNFYLETHSCCRMQQFISFYGSVILYFQGIPEGGSFVLGLVVLTSYQADKLTYST